jgi:hypothetical protein
MGDKNKSEGNGFSFQISSSFPVKDQQLVWDYVVKMTNVNIELSPYIRMTYPENMSRISERDEVPYGETLFVSVLLLFGFFPIDLHWLRFDNIVRGKAFYENSTTLLHKYWKHSRILTKDSASGCVQVTDKLDFMPRIRLFGYVLLPIIKYVFENRHMKLRSVFN